MSSRRDHIRFEIRPAPSVGGHEVLVHVNGVEMTALGAGMGMSPFALLVPRNRLVAHKTPNRVPIARCDCGTYGCGVTDAVIVRDHDVVRWTWEGERPVSEDPVFTADEYDAEVACVAGDHSWERPEDTTARLVLTDADHTRLAELGLSLCWATSDHRDPRLFTVSLTHGDSDPQAGEAFYQVFIRFVGENRSPSDLAAEVLRALDTDPGAWSATWTGAPGVRPALAGVSWKPEDLGPW